VVSARSLYICYLSLTDPLVRTQVVAYLAGLAERGHVIHLLTFETGLNGSRRRELRAEMAQLGISWHGLRYHKRPSLPATMYDTFVGAAVASWLVVRHRLQLLHARSHVPLAMTMLARPFMRSRIVFDIRGLLADEYADAGRWDREGAAYRITDWIQRVGLRRADGFVVLTERVRRQLWGETPPATAHVIPCCADFDRLAASDIDVRAALGLGKRPIMIYVGKLTGVYMDREMADFFAVARSADPDLAFVILTQSSAESIEDELRRAGIPERDYRIATAAAHEVGAYLSAADFAICFCHPKPSLIAASPTKIGEYLASGLPVVSGPDAGDTDAILRDERAGVVVSEFTDSAYERAAAEILALAADGACRDRCRAVAERVFSLREVGIPRYDALYSQMAAIGPRGRAGGRDRPPAASGPNSG
jgi:glycosyltransferase involved in cell wall biosynthesis